MLFSVTPLPCLLHSLAKSVSLHYTNSNEYQLLWINYESFNPDKRILGCQFVAESKQLLVIRAGLPGQSIHNRPPRCLSLSLDWVPDRSSKVNTAPSEPGPSRANQIDVVYNLTSFRKQIYKSYPPRRPDTLDRYHRLAYWQQESE